MDGVETLGRLRAGEHTASIPVVALTAQAMHGDRERFLEAGFDGYLSKPVDLAELLRTVEGCCGSR
jgi:CheY-like chemotaxis protein